MIKDNVINKLKCTTRFILIIGGILLLIDTVIMAFVVNFNSGIIFTGIFAIALVIIGAYFENICRVKWLAFCITAAFILMICLISFIAAYGQLDNVTYDEDAVIVFGAGINGDKVTQQLAYRLDKAVEYCNRNPNAVIVVSGGQGPQETVTEALAMERYLISRGISADRIIREEVSTSTYTNMTNSKQILDNYFDRDYKAALITSGYHVYRASKTAEAVGLDCTHCHAGIEWYSAPMRYLRECVAVVKIWLLGL